MSDEETESEEIEGPADYHCVAHTQTVPSPNHGEVEHVYFDEDVLDEWVYHELLEAIRGDGYELLAFGSVNEEEAAELDAEGIHEGGKKAVLVYRGTVE